MGNHTMRKQIYLSRKGARYFFRRRIARNGVNHPISIPLGTADPHDARRLANRLAVKWDEITMNIQSDIERYTLNIDEREAIYRNAMKKELAHATAHITSPIGQRTSTHKSLHKILSAAYRIVQLVPFNTTTISRQQIDDQIDDSWSKDEINLLEKTLCLQITPNSVSNDDAINELRALNIPANTPIVNDARSQILRGYAEAHDRAALLEDPSIKSEILNILDLLNDKKILRALKSKSQQKTKDTNDSPYFSNSDKRFSEIIDDTLEELSIDKGLQKDNGQRKAIAQRWAWITGDKKLSEYNTQDIRDFKKIIAAIPNDFTFGSLGKSGAMKEKFDLAKIPQIVKGKERKARTINRDLSVLQSISKYLHGTHWRPKYGDAYEMNFSKLSIKIEHDPNDPVRVPWTAEHLKAMFALPIWNGGGGSNKRLHNGHNDKIYQDAAYWAPLIGTYTGLAREEVCGLEVNDFDFDSEVPYLIVQSNMTRSKDGINPAGLKRKSRGRVMPIHPELIRLGLEAYIKTIFDQSNISNNKKIPIFPELYADNAKISKTGKGVSTVGGRRFYAIAWCYIVDATHAKLALPAAKNGKTADFHSLRTYNQSVLASPTVSQTLIDKHMGHSLKGTGPRNYNQRSLALGAEEELKERLKIMVSEMPNVTSEVKPAQTVQLLPLIKRSRVGSAKGRDAKRKFCQ